MIAAVTSRLHADDPASHSIATAPASTPALVTNPRTTSIMAPTEVSLGNVTSTPTSTDTRGVSVLELLASLPVEDERPDGYERDLFEHWIFGDSGCSTRELVLIEESKSLAQVDPIGCTVMRGDWFSVYDGASWSDPSDVDIDHLVALKEAWESGAWAWDAATRRSFANDLTDPRSLRAVTDEVDQSKSDADPVNWMPPRAEFWCQYLTDWVVIKWRWSLSVDENEADRIRTLLTTKCPGATTAPPTTPPIPIQFSDPTSETVVGAVNVYYATCSEARAAGAAPLYVGEPGYRTGLDRDLDGVACES